ncbi:hypothetical protein [Nitrosopumilus sp.]|uniref:hypothetical protein n=1 Tax=Nitrosopumilus sp. TaxID=2024843 RepID=UPI0034A05E3D
MNVPEIVEKINDLYHTLKNTNDPSDIANKINSVLIFGDNVSTDLLRAAWNQFAHQRGIKNG